MTTGLIGIIGSLLAIIGGFIATIIAKNKGIKQGRGDIIAEKSKADYLDNIKIIQKLNRIRHETYKTKDAVPNDWDAIDKLSAKTGATKLSEIAAPTVREDMPGKTRSNKKNDAS